MSRPLSGGDIKKKVMMTSALYHTNMPNWIFIVLAQWNNSLRVDIILNPSETVLALTPQCFVFSRKAASTNFIVNGLKFCSVIVAILNITLISKTQICLSIHDIFRNIPSKFPFKWLNGFKPYFSIMFAIVSNV
jgi:hypothetical protein